MSTAVSSRPTADPAASSGSGAALGAARRGWRRWRWLVLVAVAVGLAAVIAAVTVPRGDSDRLGPTNAGPDGSRALVQVLRHQGVDVEVRTDSRQAVTSTDGHSTLLVTAPELLGSDQLDRLVLDDAADLVLVEPDAYPLSRLAPQILAAGRSSGRAGDPACSVAAAQAAGRSRAGGFGYRLDPTVVDPDPAALCYPVKGEPGEGAYLVEQVPGHLVTVIGQSDVLTNRYLGQDGNAALALTTLGSQPKLVWYTPNPLEPSSSGGRPALADLLPDWVLWVIVQLAVVIAVVMLWRSRRLGALVPEPLPVVVRAAETQEGRARLYRQASARGRAAATLRTTTLRRLAGRLAAPPGTTPAGLVSRLAAATGRDQDGLRALLLGPAPDSDAALIALADDLDVVEKDLTRTIDPKGTLP